MTKDRFRTDFVYIFQSLGQHRFVISQLAKRAVYGRYRGTVLGVLWSLLTPLLMLGLYTFVFGSVLKIRWPDQGGGQSEFAAILFSGMLIHSMFAECLNRASTVVVSNPQYVKKIVFPLEALSWVNLFSALFQALISTAILVSYLLIVKGAVPWTVVFFPLAFLALTLFCIGVGWLISSAAVYVKDIAQVMGLVSTVLFFMAPILYPKSALPEQIQIGRAHV